MLGRLSRVVKSLVTLSQEIRFAQTEIRRFTKLAVVSRFKKDTIKLKKKGGKSTSKVDPRVTFTTTSGQFSKREKVVVQVSHSTSMHCI